MTAIIKAIETILEEHRDCGSRCAAVHLLAFATEDIANGIDALYVDRMPHAAAEYNAGITKAADLAREWGAW
jgi:hypothetical protein